MSAAASMRRARVFSRLRSVRSAAGGAAVNVFALRASQIDGVAMVSPPFGAQTTGAASTVSADGSHVAAGPSMAVRTQSGGPRPAGCVRRTRRPWVTIGAVVALLGLCAVPANGLRLALTDNGFAEKGSQQREPTTPSPRPTARATTSPSS